MDQYLNEKFKMM